MPQKRKDLNITGAHLWYLVGLITSDGCLSSDGRHIDITSKDYGFLRKLNNSLSLVNKIGIKNKGKNNQCYCIQFSNRNFYEFLLSIGLTPQKSLTQGKVEVPEEFFPDFLRGLVDGDGSIRHWIHPSNRKEQWSLRVYSPSSLFLEWLQKRIEQILRARGRIHRDIKKKPRVDMFVLKYGKVAGRTIFSKCYYDNALSLDRKMKLAEECCAADVGWKNSKTVLN